ncbi:MAG TPA: hypothetical protein VK901_08935, partial [Nitrospiraceae bacterium]|nr:hypothetical protein [Nitrospiraceae bacterium]
MKRGRGIVAKVVATGLELVEIAARLADFAKAHPRYLSVLYASTEKEFINNAKQVYRLAHISKRKRGRRSEECFAFEHLAKLSDELGRQPTKGVMTKTLINLNLSKNTAGRYAKLYQLSCLSNEERAQLSQSDQRWLREEFGSDSLSPAWWDERCWQRFEENVERCGVGEEIRKIFSGE